MKLTGLGRLVIFILVAGLAFGGWNFWNKSQNASGGNRSANNGGKGGGFQLPQIKLPSLGGSDNSKTPDIGGNAAGNANLDSEIPTDSAAGVQIGLVTSASKKGWLLDQITKWNREQSGKYRIVPQYVETREAMHGILSGTIKPVIYCPSATLWTQRLQVAWREKNGSNLVDLGDASSFRTYLKTPLVLVTTPEKAKFLRPLLGRDGGWSRLRDLSTGRLRAPWGTWKWSHADPLTANSGMMTIGAILADYADQSGQSGDLVSVASSQAFRAYVRDIERALNFDLPAQGGSSALYSAWIKQPSRYDVITAYENSALQSAASGVNLAVIYPKPTVVSEHSAAVLNGDWVTQQQQEGAQQFLQYLGSANSLRDGVREGFRPNNAGDADFAAQIARVKSQGFAQSYSAIELPPYNALNAAAFNWRGDVGKRF